MPFGPLIKRQILNQDADRPANLWHLLGPTWCCFPFGALFCSAAFLYGVGATGNLHRDPLRTEAASTMEAKIRQGAHGDKSCRRNISAEQPLDMSQFENSYACGRVAVSARHDLLVQKYHSDYCLVSFDGYLYRVSTENETGKATWPGLMHT